eukprot:752938-Hanusia_phi.AAC.2
MQEKVVVGSANAEEARRREEELARAQMELERRREEQQRLNDQLREQASCCWKLLIPLIDNRKRKLWQWRRSGREVRELKADRWAGEIRSRRPEKGKPDGARRLAADHPRKRPEYQGATLPATQQTCDPIPRSCCRWSSRTSFLTKRGCELSPSANGLLMIAT